MGDGIPQAETLHREVRVIVNADDLGMSREVNEAIFSLMARGRITSASVLANASATAEAVQMLRRFPSCSFGVHLNIVEYEPLTRDKRLAKLLDAEGRLRPIPNGFRFSLPLLGAIHAELRAQILKLRSSGVPVSHLDSHMHLHLRPPLFPVIKALQAEYGIRRLRMRSNLKQPGEQWTLRRKMKNTLYNWALRHTCGGVTTDAGADLDKFVAAAKCLPAGVRTVETLTHPGNPHYPGDIELALSPWETQLPFAVRLISFHEIER